MKMLQPMRGNGVYICCAGHDRLPVPLEASSLVWQGMDDAVTRGHLVPNERLARVICKLLAQNSRLGIDALRELSAPPRSGSSTQRRREYRREAASADFDQSLAIAIGQGWLSKGEADLVLTGKGKEIAARTRAGMHRRRETT